MDAIQNSFLQMCGAVKVTCDAQTLAWTTFAPFSAPYTDFKDAFVAVDALIGQQTTSSKGVRQIKEDQRQLVEAAVNQVAASLVLHASLQGLPVPEEAEAAPSTVRKMTEMELVGHADKLRALAAVLTPTELTGVKLTANDLTNLETRRVTFRDSIGAPRQKRVLAKEATAQLEKQIEILDGWLGQMDKAADVLQFSEPEFYGLYKGAREIIDPGYSVRQLTVKISSPAGSQIEGVEATINPGNIKKLSGPAGIFYINNLAAGTYSMILTSKSFQSKTEQFNIAANQSTIVDVEMMPNP